MTPELVRITRDGGVACATIDAGEINLMTLELFGALARAIRGVAADDDIRVLVWQSANPEFFIAHFDVHAILAMPAEGDAVRGVPNPFHEMCEQLRTMPKATICKIAGRVGGGGAEFAAACDMRFGAIGRMTLNQMEVPLGILPGGGGTQRIPRLVGRGRALEIILGGVDVDAELAAQWGWLNRALPPGELDAHVDALARRIASFPAPAIAEAKAAVLAAEPDPAAGLEEESWRFQRLLRTADARAAMEAFLQAGGQTPDGERRVAELTAEVATEIATEIAAARAVGQTAPP
jgi:enoyl-CoA hydratase/carnithine racemase